MSFFSDAEITDLNELVDEVEKLRVQQETVSRAHGITKETGASGSSQGPLAGCSAPTSGWYFRLKLPTVIFRYIYFIL